MIAIAAAASLAMTGCGGPSPTATAGHPAHRTEAAWVEEPVSFQADGATIYGTFRHPLSATRPIPAGLSFLARQTGVDRSRLAVAGHSEGGLFALLLAAGIAGHAPPVHALIMLEPLSRRYLDLIGEHVRSQLDEARRSGQLTAAVARQWSDALANAIRSLRSTGVPPGNLPPPLANLFSPSTARFLSQADRFDPAAVRLSPSVPALITCSDADIQITCSEIQHLPQSPLITRSWRIDT